MTFTRLHNYSTFLAKPGLYLEDLFVRPAARGQGAGKALLAHFRLEQLRDYFEKVELLALTRNTITDRAALEASRRSAASNSVRGNARSAGNVRS